MRYGKLFSANDSIYYLITKIQKCNGTICASQVLNLIISKYIEPLLTIKISGKDEDAQGNYQ